MEFEQNLLAGSLHNSSHEGFTQSNDPLPIIEDADEDSPF
ncbi:single-stranded DNA-binding protein [Hoylesella shahii]|nr:single-stranded DNA-binding protein [Hoylesella shahii]